MRPRFDCGGRSARHWLLRLALAGAAAGIGGCFSPSTPPCAFTCVSAGHLCPDDYTCGTDGLCHRDGAQDVCGLKPPYGAGGASAGGAGGMAGAAAGGTAGEGAGGAAGGAAGGTAGAAGRAG